MMRRQVMQKVERQQDRTIWERQLALRRPAEWMRTEKDRGLRTSRHNDVCEAAMLIQVEWLETSQMTAVELGYVITTVSYSGRKVSIYLG